MIHFFRKTRQDMLSEGRTVKYLKYAVGEVILVVVGILIALQINNWNADRKDTIIELEILRELRSALQTDLDDIAANMNSYDRRLKCHNYILEWLDSDQGFQDSLEIAISRTTTTVATFINQSAYENLKQQGMRSIKNDSLRAQISQLYEVTYKKYVTYNNNLSEEIRDINADNERHFNLSFAIPVFKDKLIVKNIEDLKNDNSFKYHHHAARMTAFLLSKLTTPTVNADVIKTIEMIDAELMARQ